MTNTFLQARVSGILLPVSALPNGPGNGDFDGAIPFIDFLVSAGVGIWQILPLGPTHEDRSPYLCLSAHAGNPGYIGLGWLQNQQLLFNPPEQSDLIETRKKGQGHSCYRQQCLTMAFDEFYSNPQHPLWRQYDQFIHRHTFWLNDFALFMALRLAAGTKAWNHWQQAWRDREHGALAEAVVDLAEPIKRIQFEQFLFFTQWQQIKDYAQQRQLLLFGDMPLFVAYDSADVWANRQYFLLDDNGEPTVLAGVPPDYFSSTGQCWGNPHYNWNAMEADNFRWWVERIRTNRELYDLIRIDHFRGLESVWEIPGGADTAEQGQWGKVPGEKLLSELYRCLPDLRFVAEDLGVITAEVNQLRQQFNLPGMAVLQFAFDSDDNNPYLPKNLHENMVVYTGTHDNNTTLGWYEALIEEQKNKVISYFDADEVDMPWSLIEMAFHSVAQLAIVPLQDILSLNSEHRINIPGTVGGNWQWRFTWEHLTEAVAERLRNLNDQSGRTKTKVSS